MLLFSQIKVLSLFLVHFLLMNWLRHSLVGGGIDSITPCNFLLQSVVCSQFLLQYFLCSQFCAIGVNFCNIKFLHFLVADI